MTEGPSSRNAFVVSFVASRPKDTPDFIIPTYDHAGERICACLSVLFGKRFDDHGVIEYSGFFGLPDLSAFSAMCLPSLPQNTHVARADHPVELDFSEAGRLAPILFGGQAEPRHLQTFQGAAKFYWRALQVAENDAESAFLSLITAGEILANGHDFEVDRLMDSATREAIRAVKEGLEDGIRIANFLSGRMRQLKRRFVSTLCNLLDDSFFQNGEARYPYARLRKDGIVRCLGAAYDLRSQYLHTGASFGWSIAPRGFDSEEIKTGKPILPDRKLARTLAASPTYVGLERVLRAALFRFAEKTGLFGPSKNAVG
jgi:hypothetical protein